MAINIFTGNNICIAIQTISFVDAGITPVNTAIIRKVLLDSYPSYIPTFTINNIHGFEEGERYLFTALQDQNLEAYVVTTIPEPQLPAEIKMSVYDSPHLYAAYDMRLETFADDDLIGTLTDRGTQGRNLNLTSTGSSRPICKTNIINGQRVLRTAKASSQFMQAASAADWKFLHNGFGYTIITVFRSRANTGEHMIYDTGAAHTTDKGIGLDFQSANGYFACSLNPLVANISVASPALMPKSWGIVTDLFKMNNKDPFTFADVPDHIIKVGGNVVGWANAVNANISVANPTKPFTIGKMDSATGVEDRLYADMDLAAIYIFDVALDEPTQAKIGMWLRDEFDIPYSTRTDLDPYYNALGNIVNHPDGLFVGWNKNNEHYTNRDVSVGKISMDGGKTYGNEIIIYRDPRDTHDIGGANLTLMSDNTIVMVSYSEDLAGALVTPADDAFILKSSDGGRTWGPRIPITNHGFTGLCAAESHICEPTPGTWLVPVYGNDTGPVSDFMVVKLMQTTDAGVTWTLKGIIADGVTDELRYNEVFLFKNATTGNYVAFIREETTFGLYRFTSPDAITWTSHGQIFTGFTFNCGRGMIAASGRLYLPIRNNARGMIFWSDDAAGDFADLNGYYYADGANAQCLGSGLCEIETGKFIYALWSELIGVSFVGPDSNPGAAMSYGRTIQLLESEIIANSISV